MESVVAKWLNDGLGMKQDDSGTAGPARSVTTVDDTVLPFTRRTCLSDHLANDFIR